jgi:hypothetical protein
MNNDEALDRVTEAYIQQRLYAPRIKISDEFRNQIIKEYQRLNNEGIHHKRITAAIEFLAKSIEKDFKFEKPVKQFKHILSNGKIDKSSKWEDKTPSNDETD